MVEWQQRIAIAPAILVGKPIIRGTRLAVEFIIDLLTQGWAESEILRNYTGLTSQDVQTCFVYSSATLRADKVYPVAV